ncbi:hypothetical protein PTI45_03963 [Paenibacillus nuruki]|uniref:Uncharacterized protein n=1 Tax=Paenibacillus nuruki TaxID=1886670 RepID=A0A1E3KYW8_9BACL|nr:hypothetical protein [Paenibacillus nuruki]ODP26684.1 hypothetical protein PTI45_03963 [Paenibacillus nuruki]
MSFTKDDVKNLIASGVDNVDQYPVVTKEGKLVLVPVSEYQSNREKYPVRYDSFDSGNGYVGKKASKDKAHVSAVYKDLLSGWTQYENGETVNNHLNY